MSMHKKKRDCIKLLLDKFLVSKYSIASYGGVDYFTVMSPDGKDGNSSAIKSWDELYKEIEAIPSNNPADKGIDPKGMTDEELVNAFK